ncbi:MAG: cytochrome bc complex cytochrome b subunit [Burkholderiales bacterium]
MEKLLNWVDARFPLTALWESQWGKYVAPKNFNFWYYFGSLATLVLVMQILTGIFLTMNYKPDAQTVRVGRVHHAGRGVGRLIRYMRLHRRDTSVFFVVVYLHMFRGLMYGSYRKPRELLWIFGCLIYLVLMGEAFFGYLLPWGQMSYWGAQVIVNLFSTVPVIGEGLGVWIRGDYTISDITLNRFFRSVIAFPLVLLGLVAAHLMALHEVGSNNPDGIEIEKQPKDPKTGLYLDGIYSHPYYTIKDIVGVVAFLIVFSIIMFFMPDMGGYFLEANNFIPADPLKTPEHIAPVWYFTPFYAMLRAVPSFLDSQFWGVLVMGAGVVILFFLPWLDRGAVKSIRYRGTLYKSWLAAFVISFLILGYLGVVPVTVWGQFSESIPLIGGVDKATIVARILTVVYFLFFLLMPWYTVRDKTKPVPERTT